MTDEFSQPDPEEQQSAPVPAADHVGVPHEFKGRTLEPFSIRRQAAAQALGNKLLSGTAKLEVLTCECGCKPKPEADAEEDPEKAPDCPLCRDTGRIFGMYDGMFIDIVVMIYLCVCPTSVVLRAARRPDEVMTKALEWAEKEQIAIGSKTFSEASFVYGSILDELQAAQFKVSETASGAKPKNAPGGLPTAA